MVRKKKSGVSLPLGGGGFNLPETEERVLAFWRAERIVETSLTSRAGEKNGKRCEFVFYEGPPSANGRPGMHHVISRVFKDVILRYKTMRGYFVPRKSGWDTHGLPVEIAAEKELGLASKKDIDAYGIAAFNRKCREIVWNYLDEWTRFTDRIGFWLDLKNPYITYKNDYIESLWWIIAQFAKRGLLYKGHKIVNWCPRCGTGLSSHELAQGYKEVTDASVYVKFKVKPGKKPTKTKANNNFSILAWTTTPWTLPGNVALAVGARIRYAIVRFDGEYLLLAKDLIARVVPGAEVIQEMEGRDLEGLEYEPLFDVPFLNAEAAYRVYSADFVTTADGTGIVHTAVMYGEDDYALGIKLGLPTRHTVDESGRFVQEVPDLAGMQVKAQETEEAIFAHLKKKNNLLRIEHYTHEYPFCWRCETPLLYYARTSWFVAVNKVRSKLLQNNEAVTWIPEHLKRGRFGEWLKEKKDWNFSRERYWGTPLPIWECAACGMYETVGSIAELGAKTGSPRNKYWVMRHAYPESVMLGVIDSGQGHFDLTPRGVRQAHRAGGALRKEKIDVIVSSNILRAKETATILSEETGAPVVYEPRFREIYLAGLSGKKARAYYDLIPNLRDRFVRKPEGGESLTDVRARVWAGLAALEKKYKGKKILIVSHEYPIWMMMQAAEGWDEDRALQEARTRRDHFVLPAEIRRLAFVPGPRNEMGELDLHRPYIDAVAIPCATCGKKMMRVQEVADVWFDSGAMPFAQAHFPFPEEGVGSGAPCAAKQAMRRLAYPADYICEAVDQTRGWFYTLLAVGTLLGEGTPYKNVISLGHINDKYGRKMSKSKGNVLDPWEIMGKYGIDAVRWYLYAATPPGEPKNFDEAELVKTFRRVHLILYNSFVFYETYGKKIQNTKTPVGGGSASGGETQSPSPKHVLDKWILARLGETIRGVTARLDVYAVREAALLIEVFVDDLSRWYIRRSRMRFQPDRRKGGAAARDDYAAASATLGYALRTLSLLIAPFMPFYAEALYGSLDAGGDSRSVHLADWPKAGKELKNNGILAAMEDVRALAALALAARAAAGIKVRQPLAEAKIRSEKLEGKEEFLRILADEVNVKCVVIDRGIKDPIELDMRITDELREEGMLRDLVRAIQGLRQEAKYKPKDGITLFVSAAPAVQNILAREERTIRSEVGAKSISLKRNEKCDAHIETRLDTENIWIGIKKS